MIRGIIFDFGGVFNNAHESMAGFAFAAERFGHSPEALYDLFYGGAAWQDAKLGRITGDAYWRSMMRELGLDPTGDLAAFRADLFRGERLDPDVVAIAERLHRRFPLALLSNATDELDALLDDPFKVRHLFKVVVNSATAGVAKPEPAAYELALAGLNLPASDVLFIDDKPRNIAAAEALGIHSLLFTTANQLEADLEALGLLP